MIYPRTYSCSQAAIDPDVLREAHSRIQGDNNEQHVRTDPIDGSLMAKPGYCLFIQINNSLMGLSCLDLLNYTAVLSEVIWINGDATCQEPSPI